MSDDDSVGSGEDYDYQDGAEESRIDALARLHDACNTFGAAPTHPDWLDRNCNFHDTITAEFGKENAVRALECLKKIGLIANKEHAKAMKSSLIVLTKNSCADLVAETATDLCSFSLDNANKMLNDRLEINEICLQKAIASAFKIPRAAIIDFYNDSAGSGWRAAKEAWMLNSSQKIIGMIQNQSIDGIEASHCEYRAGGDWEILLAETLTRASTGCGIEDRDTSIWKSFKIGGKLDEKVKEILGYFMDTERWFRVSTCVISQSMPAAALLRFCLMGGKGRDPHPLRVNEGEKPGSKAPTLELHDEKMEPLLILSKLQQETVLSFLSLLAHRSARSHGDDLLKRSCGAVATNLLDKVQSFHDIEGMEALSIAFETMGKIEDILTEKGICDERLVSFCYILGRLIAMIQTRGNTNVMSNKSKVTRLLAFLGSGSIFGAAVFGKLLFKKKHILKEETRMREDAIKSIVHLLSSEEKYVDGDSRSRLASMMGKVVELENTIDPYDNVIRASLLIALDSLTVGRLEKVVELTFPSLKETVNHNDGSVEAGLGIGRILAYILTGIRKDTSSLKFCEKVFRQLQKCSENKTLHALSRESGFGILFLYACRIGSLGLVGSSFVAKLNSMSKNEVDLIPMGYLMSFVRGLQTAIQSETVAKHKTNVEEAERKIGLNIEIIPSNNPVTVGQKKKSPRACSYVLRNGFFQQHWYNCYTCGLVVDKGCCALCALTCHRGHEVAYSRYSSFFCDCGAEMGSAVEQNRVVCQCITPLMAEEADELFEEERSKNYLSPKNSCCTSLDNCNPPKGPQFEKIPLFIDIAGSFRDEALSAIEKIKNEALITPWVGTFLDILKEQSHDEEVYQGEIYTTPSQCSLDSISAGLANRRGKELELKRLEDINLVPICAARAGSFNVKMSVETTTDRLKRAMLNRHGIVRKVAVADSRGRLLVAEPCSLIFCSLLPAVNTRFIKDSLANLIGRAQMSVISSYAMSFNIVGMEICRANERHIVIWGATEACVVILKQDWNGVDQIINLEFEVDPHDCESDYLVCCSWIPSSQTQVSVTCGTFVKTYDIATVEKDGAISSILSYSIAYEALIKDVAWISFPYNLSPKKLVSMKRTLILFLLMDTGRIHNVRVNLDNRGEINGCGCIYIASSSSSVDIPTGGIRPYEGVATTKAGSSTKSLGDGSSLCYLPRLKILLYKCVSSCVIALMFNDAGSVIGSFELLPNRIESEILGTGSDTHSIVGPFNHWTEIGIMQDDYFRLVCVGKSSRTNQPKMLCIDINLKGVHVKELSWSGGSVDLGLSLSSSFEAIVPFSAPILSDGTSFTECLYLCAITSNGAILIYGECPRMLKKNMTSSKKSHSEKVQTTSSAKPSIALTIYEDLLNISEIDELKFSGDGIGSDSETIKSKLSTKNSVYLMSPSRDGFALAVWVEKSPIEVSKLKNGTELSSPKIPTGSGEGILGEQLVVVAFRLLVGSTTNDCVPSKVYVQGRPVDLTPDTKRWYDLPLTLEEVVMAVRNGYVSISFGPTFEAGNNPLIDAVEVYAVEKQKLIQFIPTRLQKDLSLELRDISAKHSSSTRILVSAIRILSDLFQILKTSLDINTPEGRSLKQLVRKMTLMKDRSIRTSVVDLLKLVENDGGIRQKFLDEGTVIGLSEALSVWKEQSCVEQNLGLQLQSLIEASLRPATSIALSRPENYLNATEQLQSEGFSSTSIGLDASEIILSSMKMDAGFADFLKDIVHLVLAEMNISKSDSSATKIRFASFDVIAKLFKSDNHEIVEESCKAIKSFVEIHGTAASAANLLNITDADGSEQPAPIAYQCDSCSLFPITDTRYTLLEDDHDIDLCTKCYQLGRVFAQENDYSANIPVIINRRSIGGGTKLSCSQISQMQSIPIENGNAIAEQVEQALKEAKSAGICAQGGTGGNSLNRALLLSQHNGQSIGSGTQQESSQNSQMQSIENESGSVIVERIEQVVQDAKPAGTETSSHKIVINFEKFTDTIFDDILSHLGTLLDNISGIQIGNVNPLLSLLIDIIKIGHNETSYVVRGKRYVGEIVKHVCRILVSIRSSSRSEASRYVLLINLLRSLSRLIGLSEEDSTGNEDDGSDAVSPTETKSKGKTDPRFVCDIHGVAAVRRRCSTGINKNRRFYVCGMERNRRCKYFKWADEPKTAVRSERCTSAGPWFEKEIECTMWHLLSNNENSQLGTLSDQLCDLLEVELSRSEGIKGKETRPSQMKSPNNQSNEFKKSEISSLYSREAALDDFNDGIFCSKEKIFGSAPQWLCHIEPISEPREVFLRNEETDDQILSDKFIEASLELVSTVASASSPREPKTTGYKRWFSLLCEVISMSPTTRFRSQAKKALKRMCGGDRELYHRVRDHYVFSFQFKEILYHSYTVLDGALCVREQARQSSDRWNEDEPSWDELNAGALLGTLNLISEDCLTVDSSSIISSITNEVLTATKSRGNNWRIFCSLQSLPESHRKHGGLTMLGSKESEAEHLFASPPILSLFWLCCSMSGPNQIQVLKLIDIALTTNKKTGTETNNSVGSFNTLSRGTEGIASNISKTKMGEVYLPFASYPQRMPEETLMKGVKGLSLKEIYSFIIEFVLRGKTTELRQISGEVAYKLCIVLKPNVLASLFDLLTDKPFFEFENLGCASVELLELLQKIVQYTFPSGSIQMINVVSKVAEYFTIQMNLFNAIGKGQFFLEGSRENFLKRFDIADCIFCHRQHCSPQRNRYITNSLPPKEKKTSRDSKNKSGSEKGLEIQKTLGTQWLPDQVRPFTKSRLDASTDNTVSSEFVSFVKLKCRLSISEIRLTISDPRGRYVKKIIIFFTPRQVAAANQLKTEDYQHLWQKCAELSLSQGATNVSTVLKNPITAANLKFEYKDFYDRAGGTRTANGSFVLFCPRCSRQVNNAHGVCGNCGECVFQCRRCRHIQYDRPDAFLCTECGHCSSGSFTYELMAGVASNAVAIVDDESYKRTVKITKTATKLHSELQSTLVERLRIATRKRTNSEVDFLSQYNPTFKRALIGDLPKLGNEQANINGISSNQRGNAGIIGRSNADRPSSNVASRARSLLRLARQLRNDSGDHARQREIILRETFLGNREFSLEEIDEADGADIIGLLGSGTDRDDPLNRIVATISNRQSSDRNARTCIDSEVDSGGSANRSTKKLSHKATAEKLNQLRREAERECHELKQRLNAWNRLEHNSLPEDSLEFSESFKASACSRCAGALTLNLLLLILRLFQTNNIKRMDNFITKKFIRSLFLEPSQMHKELFELRRTTITTLCTKSEHAAKLILEELRCRLRASSDTASASILGKLLQHDFPLTEDFLTLATETLSKNYML